MDARTAHGSSRALGVLALVLAFAAGCNDSDSKPPPDAGPAKTPCLDRPSDPQRPPSAGLPCDLLPPDFGKK